MTLDDFKFLNSAVIHFVIGISLDLDFNLLAVLCLIFYLSDINNYQPSTEIITNLQS